MSKLCDFHRFSTAVMSLLHSTHPNAGAVPKIPWIPPRAWAWGTVTSCIHLPRFQVVHGQLSTHTYIIYIYIYPEFRYEIKSKPILVVLKHTWAAQKNPVSSFFYWSVEKRIPRMGSGLWLSAKYWLVQSNRNQQNPVWIINQWEIWPMGYEVKVACFLVSIITGRGGNGGHGIFIAIHKT